MRARKPGTAVTPGAVRIIRAFGPRIAGQKRLLVLSAFAVGLCAAFQLLEPWPLKLIYDTIFHARAQATRFPLLNRLGPAEALALSAASMVAIIGLASLADYAGTVLLSLAASRILAEIRRDLFQHLANLSISFHARNKTGDMVTRVTYDIDRIREVLVGSVLPMIINGLTLVSMAAVMFWMNWRLAQVAVLAFPLFFAAVLRLTRKVKEVARVHRSREGAIAATAAEAIGSIRVIHALSLQSVFLALFSAANKKSLEAGIKVQKLSAGLERTAEILAGATIALVLWVGARIVMDGHLTPGDLIVFVTYMRISFKPLRQLAKYLGQIAKAVASGERILELMQTPPEIADGPASIAAPRLAGHIQFENVCFGYEPGRAVLRQVSFLALPGQKIAVVGPSGAGKSTIASLMLRFHDPDSGRILIDGRDIREYRLESLRSQMSTVMQESALFAVSVRENIGFGAAGTDRDEVVAAARLANADGFIGEMPKGYETVLGERGATLSGGQRQRIAIARAAVRRAPILILDEPTAGLDRKNEQEVAAALDRLSKGRTTILITHNLEACSGCDQVLYVRAGEIAERGTHEELLKLDGEYAAMYWRQSSDWLMQEDGACEAFA